MMKSVILQTQTLVSEKDCVGLQEKIEWFLYDLGDAFSCRIEKPF